MVHKGKHHEDVLAICLFARFCWSAMSSAAALRRTWFDDHIHERHDVLVFERFQNLDLPDRRDRYLLLARSCPRSLNALHPVDYVSVASSKPPGHHRPWPCLSLQHCREQSNLPTARQTHPKVPSPSFLPMSYASRVDVPSKALPYASSSSCSDGRANFLGQTGPRGIESVRGKGCGVDALVVGLR